MDLTVCDISQQAQEELVAGLRPTLGVDSGQLWMRASTEGTAFIQLIGEASAWVTPLKAAAAAFLLPFLAQLGKKTADHAWEKRERIKESLSNLAAAPLKKVASVLVGGTKSKPDAELVIGIPVPEKNWGTAITFRPADEEEVAWILALFVTKVEEIEAAMHEEVRGGHLPLGRAQLTLQEDGSFVVRWMDQVEHKRHERKIR